MNSSPLFDNLMSYKQAAQYLGISEAYLRRIKAKGQVPFVPFGRAVRFDPHSLKQWVRKREIK